VIKNNNLLLTLCAGGILMLSNSNGITASLIELTQDTANGIIEQSEEPVIIDFYADWCQPCKQMGPIFDEFAQKYGAHYQCVKVNFDKEQDLAKKYNVVMLPTFVVIKKGKVLGKIVGMATLEQFQEKVEQVIQGIDFSAMTKQQLKQKLHEALKSYAFDDIQALIQAGVNVNEPFEDGTTPLLMAASFGPMLGEVGLNIVKMFLDAGALPEARISIPGMPESKTVIGIAQMSVDNMTRMVENGRKIVSILDEHANKTKTTIKDISCTGESCAL
jgi:thioredoxin